MQVRSENLGSLKSCLSPNCFLNDFKQTKYSAMSNNSFYQLSIQGLLGAQHKDIKKKMGSLCSSPKEESIPCQLGSSVQGNQSSNSVPLGRAGPIEESSVHRRKANHLFLKVEFMIPICRNKS